MDSAMRCTGKPEVLVVTIAPGLRNCATRDSKFLLISRFSATTSMIQSASAQRAKSSSKFPMEIFSASAGTKNAAGFDFFAASSPARTILWRSPAGAPDLQSGGTMSSRMHGRPALAKCAAIREPMVPAPNTAAFSIRRFMACLFRSPFYALRRLDRLQNRHPLVKRTMALPQGPRYSMVRMSRGKVTDAIGWLQSAKERLLSLAEPDERKPTERPRVGLALSGGFARGIAHIGVLRILREAGIPIDFVAGTSVGALIGAAFCAGTPLDEMERIGTTTSFTDFGRWTPSWLGLATNQRLEKFLAKFTSVKTFEEMAIPLAIATTDINAGVSVYYTRGPIGLPLRASCAYPGLFVPIQYEGRTLVDGFLTAPVPVEGAMLLGAEIIIAVYLESGNHGEPRTFTDVLSRSFNIIQRHADIAWRAQADVIIEPDVKPFLWDDFTKTPELVAAGEQAARRALPEIRAAIGGEKRDSAA